MFHGCGQKQLPKNLCQKILRHGVIILRRCVQISKKILQLRRFSGGISSFTKIGPEYSASDITLDIFQDPSFMTMPRAASKVSGSVLDNLVVWAVDGSPFDTNRYFYDLGGKIAKETSGGTWSSIRTVSGGAGEGMEIFDDYLYYALATELGRYGRLSGTPAFDDALTSWWDGSITDIQDTGGSTGNTYTTPTSINEGATHRQTWTANYDPIKEITFNVVAKGTGNVTVTVHDAENNLIGSKTIATASISAAANNTFTFAIALRTVIGNPYHFHVTSTVADTTINTTTSSDLEDAQYTIEYGVLIDEDFHPMIVVEDKLIIGNEQYLAVFDQSTYEPNKILLGRGYKARTITKLNEYIVVGAYKGDSIDKAEAGALFYWDTIAASWNYSTDTTTIGAPHTLTNTGNKLRGIYGNKGGLYEGDNPFQSLLNRMSTLYRTHTLEFYPSSLSGAENITLIAVSGNSTDGGASLNIRKGVYAYGAQEATLPDSFVYLYRMSTGNITDNGLKIGFVKVFGSDTYFSWKDVSGNYGVDKVAVDANSLDGQGSYTTLVFDAGDAKKDILLLKATCSFKTLASNETVSVNAYLNDRDTTLNGVNATAGDTKAELLINRRARNIEIYIIVETDGTYPQINEIALYYDDLSEEKLQI